MPPRDYPLATQLMLTVGPMVRAVADLRLLLPILAGRDIRDPRSVDAPLSEPEPPERTAAIVSSLPGAPLPASAARAVQRAGELLRAAGWEVEEATPPDLLRVSDVFSDLLAGDVEVLQHQLRSVISDSLSQHLQRLAKVRADERRPQAAARVLSGWLRRITRFCTST